MAFSKIIEFSTSEDYLDTKQDHPEPASHFIPAWYKKLNYKHDHKTAKGCMPFLDTLTAGYILKVPQDYRIAHNILNEETNKMDSYQGVAHSAPGPHVNLNYGDKSYHEPFQLLGSKQLEKNKNLPFHKISNPWIIKTPPGYSCLFVPPLNNKDDRFEILPGIVDTDTYEKEINFPFLINGDKYPTIDTTIEKGTPYVQVMPFLRDNWKMKITKRDTEKYKRWYYFYGLAFMNNYKKLFWKKKKYK
jgi:hypothetical protein